MIDTLADVHFLRPLWLLAILPAIGLFLIERRLSDEGDRWRGIIAPELLAHLLVGAEARRRVRPVTLLLPAWILAALAVAGPTFEREPSPFADAKPPVMILLKVAPSMLATDLAPTRLDRARQKLADLLALREGAATGLIAYAGTAHLVLPPTADGDVLLEMVRALSPEIMPKEGDDLAAAIAEARSVLAGSDQGGSVLVLADAVASGEAVQLGSDGPPTTILAMLPPDSPAAPSLSDAAASLDAALVATTVDSSDVTDVAARLDRVGVPREVEGEGTHWKEAGYWLTPILTLLVLIWFRRGWVLA